MDLIVVPARKNSSRLKNKNILKIKKKTLIEYTLNFVRKLRFKNIVISTDSVIIKNIAKKKNFNIDYNRPSSLSKNTTNMADTVLHAVNWYEKKNNVKVENIILFQPTSPLRSKKNVYKAINLFKSKKILSLTSITKININKKNFFLKKKNKISIIKHANDFFKIDGNVYIIKKKILKKFKRFTILGKTYFHNSNQKYTIDIDYIEDFNLAKFLIEKNIIKI
tara:strand:- start:401 stop:1066 length:666 start_codon:yes stop_codon:yes gene_type:complete